MHSISLSSVHGLWPLIKNEILSILEERFPTNAVHNVVKITEISHYRKSKKK